MSVEAITWALGLPVTHSSAKFVLVVLANCATADTMLAFPSVQYVSSATGQDRKTVLNNLARLREWKLIEDTGHRRGETKQIVVYRLLIADDLFENDPKSGTVPKTERSQKRNSSENGGKQSRFSAKQSQKRDTEPSEPSETKNQKQQRDSKRGSRLPDGWAPSEAVRGWARSEFPAVSLDVVLAEFADYWRSVPGQRGTKLDWNATFRNRVREVAARQPRNPRGTHRESVAERVARINAEAERRERGGDDIEGDFVVV